MPTKLTVTRTEELTPSLRRVWFRSDDLSAFAESRHTDRYVKLLFPQPGTTIPDDFDARAARATWAPQDLPTIRTYTALFRTRRPGRSPSTSSSTVTKGWPARGRPVSEPA